MGEDLPNLRYQLICGRNADGKLVSAEELGIRCVPGWLYAVHFADAEGWQWEASPLDIEAYGRALEEGGIKAADIVEIQKYPIDQDMLDPPGRFRFVTKRWRGWAYDVTARCWRAPYEALTPFPGAPPRVASLDITFSVPEAGWLPITLEAGGRTLYFEASDDHDPFPDLMRWLESVADGRFARLCIDGEDIYYEFHVFPHDGDLVRLAVTVDKSAISGTDRTVEIDVVIERGKLLSSIYVPFIMYWEGDGLRENADHWHFGAGWEDYLADDEKEYGPYPLRSPRLEALLGMT